MNDLVRTYLVSVDSMKNKLFGTGSKNIYF